MRSSVRPRPPTTALLSPGGASPTGAGGFFVPKNGGAMTSNLNRPPAQNKTEALQYQNRNPPRAARVSRVVMRASRRKNTKGKCEGKVVIRSAACAAFALGLLLAPAPARCADGPAPLTVEDCLGTSKRPHAPPWVDGTSGPDTCWGALHDSDSSYLDISPPLRFLLNRDRRCTCFALTGPRITTIALGASTAPERRTGTARTGWSCISTSSSAGLRRTEPKREKAADVPAEKTSRDPSAGRAVVEIPRRRLARRRRRGGGGRLHAASRSGALSAGESRVQWYLGRIISECGAPRQPG